MADATAEVSAGTTSTPPATAATVAPVTAAPAPATDQSTTPTSQVTAPVSPEPVAAPVVQQDAAPSDQPLFTLPEGTTLAPELTQKFEGFLRTKLVDGKAVMTSQEVADHFLDLAKDANSRWMKQMEDLNASNETACKSRFTPAQLSQAEAAVGFASSIDPGFREFAKRQLNDPVFVNFMREIGERLSEDEFERGTIPSLAPRKGPMTRAEAGKTLYGKSLKTN